MQWPFRILETGRCRQMVRKSSGVLQCPLWRRSMARLCVQRQAARGVPAPHLHNLHLPVLEHPNPPG